MAVKLRDYQEQALEGLRTELRRLGREDQARRVLLVAPTGAGKTTVAAEIIKGAEDRGNPVLFLAHAKELIEQASARLALYGIGHGIIKAGIKETPGELVQVASVQTLKNRPKPPARVIVVDEAHRAMAKTYLEILEHYPDAAVIGLTATPIRMDGKGLGDLFNALVEAARIEDLVSQGVLHRPRVFAPWAPDLSGVKTSQGDYHAGQLAEAMDRPAIVGNIVDHWLRLAEGQRTVVFASSVQHSKSIRDAFRAAGIVAEHIDGTTPEDERAAILQGLEAGTVQVVSNCSVLTEGWDCPPCAVAVLARPTKSLALYLQMVGRVLRTADGKKGALVLDHSGCTLDHGFVTTPRAWELGTGKAKQPAPSVKSCPVCFAVVASETSDCPCCEYRWTPETVTRQIETDEAARLREMSEDPRYWWLKGAPIPANPKKATAEDKQAMVDHLARLASGRPGIEKKGAWLRHKFKEVFGVWPRVPNMPQFPGEEFSFRTAMKNRERRAAS